MRKNREIKLVFTVLAVFFAGFLAVPMISVLVKSFTGNGEAASLSHYVEVLTGRGFLRALGNSIVISVCSALLATVLAFILAYTIHYTNTGKRYKWLIGNIGEIYPEDIEKVCELMKNFLEEYNHEEN